MATTYTGGTTEQVSYGATDGLVVSQSSSDKIAFHGGTPISQRAAAAQATSTVGTASSTAVDTNLKASVIEIMNTLNNLGIWKGSA